MTAVDPLFAQWHQAEAEFAVRTDAAAVARRFAAMCRDGWCTE